MAEALAKVSLLTAVAQCLPTFAGCIVAAVRMALWTVLILLDSEWLTDNATTIDGEHVLQH